jgi:mono/diheme cytochrome c family protein
VIDEDSVKVYSLAALIGICLTMGVVSQTPERTDYSSGAYLYQTFCASCHGTTGHGDGRLADLGPRPSDLTRLSATHGGVFPRAEVKAVLDGTRRLPGHQTDAMPNWRDVLRRTERVDDRTLNVRIEALVSHVESLQK